MPTLYIMVGIAGAGKSTWAKKHLPGAAYLSTDDIRVELYGTADNVGNSKEVFGLLYKRLQEALKHNTDVVLDATFLTPKVRAAALKYCPADMPASAVFIDVPLWRAIQNDSLRSRHVPPQAIATMHKKLIPPTKEEGFQEIIHVKYKS